MYGTVRPLKNAFAVLLAAQLFAVFLVLALPGSGAGIKETLGHVHHGHSKLLLSHVARVRLNHTSVGSTGNSRIHPGSCQALRLGAADPYTITATQMAMSALAAGALPSKRWLVLCSLLI